jgi:hypothetical protein
MARCRPTSTYRVPRRYRYPHYRYGPRKITGKQAAIGAVVAVIAAGAAHPAAVKGAVHHEAAGLDAAIPAGSDLDNPSGWARALLAADSLPLTACNLSAVTEWEAREGGGFGNQAAYDPLNVNPGPGAGWPGHPAIGAWAFPSAAIGLRYTVATLGNGDYAGILATLRAGNSAQAVCDAIEDSPWAASHYGYDLTASC